MCSIKNFIATVTFLQKPNYFDLTCEPLTKCIEILCTKYIPSRKDELLWFLFGRHRVAANDHHVRT